MNIIPTSQDYTTIMKLRRKVLVVRSLIMPLYMSSCIVAPYGLGPEIIWRIILRNLYSWVRQVISQHHY